MCPKHVEEHNYRNKILCNKLESEVNYLGESRHGMCVCVYVCAYVCIYVIMYRLCKGKDKGTVRPRRGHEGPEGEWRYSFTLPLTSALDAIGGQRHAPAALPPGERRDTHSIAGWVGLDLDGCGKSRPHLDSNPGP